MSDELLFWIFVRPRWLLTGLSHVWLKRSKVKIPAGAPRHSMSKASQLTFSSMSHSHRWKLLGLAWLYTTKGFRSLSEMSYLLGIFPHCLLSQTKAGIPWTLLSPAYPHKHGYFATSNAGLNALFCSNSWGFGAQCELLFLPHLVLTVYNFLLSPSNPASSLETFSSGASSFAPYELSCMKPWRCKYDFLILIRLRHSDLTTLQGVRA